MASITKRPDGRWRARYRDAAGKEHAKHFARKLDGQRWLDEVSASIVTGQYIDPAAGRVTVREYAELWRARQVHRDSTAVRTEAMLRRHVYPALGDRPLSSVLPGDVQALVKRLGDDLQPASVVGVHRLVAGIFRAAVRDRRIPASPCDGVRLPRVERPAVEPLTLEAVQALASAVQPRYGALVLLAAGTGLRQGEAFGLTVDRIDFLRRTLRVDRQLVLLPGREPFLAPPKTAASVRTVPLPQVTVDTLARHLADHPASADGLVFSSETGRPLRRTRFSERTWQPAVTAAGLPKGTRFHDLRHFYASLLIRHGESVKTVQARLGHASAAETLDTYSHLWPDSDDRTRTAVDAVLGAAAADQVRTAGGT